MKKIESLTPAQVAKFPEYIERWTDIGLSTLPADRGAAEAAIADMYRQGGLSPPEKIVWCGSPLSQGLTRAIILDKNALENLGASVRASVGDSVWASVRASVWASVRASVWDSVWASVRDSVWASVGDSVRDSVRDSVWASVRDSVRASVRDSVWASVGDSVRASVRDSVWASVRDSVRDSVGDSVRDSVWASVRDSVWASVRDSVGGSVWGSVRDSVGASGYGQHDANCIAFYEFFRIECGLVTQTEKLSGMTQICKSAGWFLPHKNICLISERHNSLHRNAQGRLHADEKPALTYPDGWSLYRLNGIPMTEKQVMTPAEKLDPKEIMQETNADVRRELIRKVGIERMLTVLPNRVMDKVGEYQLLSIKLSDELQDARYLKMLNPSIGAWHLEGVAPECDTVEKCLNWRNQHMFTNAEVLT